MTKVPREDRSGGICTVSSQWPLAWRAKSSPGLTLGSPPSRSRPKLPICACPDVADDGGGLGAVAAMARAAVVQPASSAAVSVRFKMLSTPAEVSGSRAPHAPGEQQPGGDPGEAAERREYTERARCAEGERIQAAREQDDAAHDQCSRRAQRRGRGQSSRSALEGTLRQPHADQSQSLEEV